MTKNIPSKQNSSKKSKAIKKTKSPNRKPKSIISMLENVFSNPAKYAPPQQPKSNPKNKGMKKNSNGKNKSGVEGLSLCAMKYALAISQPFHPSARSACIPCAPSLPSQKVTSFNRQPISLNVNGYAAAYIHPCMANNGALITYTNGPTYLGSPNIGFSAFSATNVLTVGALIASPTNLPYDVNTLITNSGGGNASVFGRVVSVGVKVSYTGTTLNESGLYSLYASSTHENVSSMAYSPVLVGQLQEADICGISRKSCHIATTTTNTREYSYSNSNLTNSAVEFLYPYSNGEVSQGPGGLNYVQSGHNIGSPVIAIHMTGVSGSTFLIEVIQHIEYAGPATSALATNSELDINGFNVVNAAASKMPSKKLVSKAEPIKMMYECIQEVFEEIKPIAVSSFLKFAGSAIL